MIWNFLRLFVKGLFGERNQGLTGWGWMSEITRIDGGKPGFHDRFFQLFRRPGKAGLLQTGDAHGPAGLEIFFQMVYGEICAALHFGQIQRDQRIPQTVVGQDGGGVAVLSLHDHFGLQAQDLENLVADRPAFHVRVAKNKGLILELLQTDVPPAVFDVGLFQNEGIVHRCDTQIANILMIKRRKGAR